MYSIMLSKPIEIGDLDLHVRQNLDFMHFGYFAAYERDKSVGI